MKTRAHFPAEARTPRFLPVLGRGRVLLALACLAVALTSSCKLAQAAVEMPGQILAGPEKEKAFPTAAVQAGVMRFADTFASRINQATRDFAEEAGTPEARIQGMTWVVGQTTAAFTIATGANPNANMLDMIVLVTLGRMVHEEHWMKVWGEADRPMLQAFKKLEEEIWTVARALLTDEQQAAVRGILDSWRKKNPDMAVTAFVRLPAFQDVLATSETEQTNVFSELSSLMSIDLLAGLDPTLREVEQARLLLERSLYYFQRVPMILPVQAELLGAQLTELPAVTAVLSDSERFSHAATSLAETVVGLPEAVRAEREAAVEQISQELTRQREGLVRDLDAAQEPAQQILSEARATMVAGTEMSSALQGTIESLDGFIGGFRKEEGAAEPAPDPAAEPRKPFDVSDYGEAAARIGTAANELSRLVTTLEQSLPEARVMVDEVAQRSERTIDHAFARGLALGALLIAAAALAMLLVRWVSLRMARRPSALPES